MPVSPSIAETQPPAEKGPRARMRRLMIQTAVRLMQSGVTPTVREVAEAADVSRATAYRYFPNHAAMLEAVVSEALGPILDWKASAGEPKERIAELLTFAHARMHDYEATHRAALTLALTQWSRRRAGMLDDETPIVRGNRKPLLREAIAPLRGQISEADFDRLMKALSLTFGVEALIVLHDIWGLSKEEAVDVAVWAAQSLVDASLKGNARDP